jgi:hypothetical protein
MTRDRRLLALAAALALLTGTVREARAEEPDRDACVAAYQAAQVSMRRASLRSARAELQVCLSDSCAGALRSDCAQWLNEVEARLPGVVLVCEGPDGRGRADARVEVDGAPFADRLEGKSLAIDPGEHTFRFELPGEAPLDVRFVVNEGDKLQRVVGRFPRAARPEPGPVAPAPARRPVPWTVYALGGIGVVAAGGFTYAGIAGLSGKSDLESCKPECSSSSISAVHTKFVVADVLLGVSVVSLAAATYLYLTRGTASPATVAVF